MNYLIFLIFLVGLMFYGLLIPKQQRGGSRSAIFSRFSYQPDFPFISQFDTVNLDRFSRVYNEPGPVKFVQGRPYRLYQSEDSTWLYPWEFPQKINYRCLRVPSDRCHEPPIITVKKAKDKLKGLAVESPKEIVRVTPCYSRWYEKCMKEERGKN